MKKQFAIKNKHGLIIRGAVEWYGDSYGPLVILCHGLLAKHTQPQVGLTAHYLAQAGYTAVAMSATNNVGLSDGSFFNFTTSGYIEDIKAVINYFLKKTGQRSCTLIGYSIGALACYVIASRDRRVRRLVLQGPVYDFSAATERNVFKPLHRLLGWAWQYSETLGRRFKLGYGFYTDGVRYKPDGFLKQVLCPTLVIYGSKEMVLEKRDFLKLFRVLRCPKKIIQISQAGHTIRGGKKIREFSELILNWLKNNEQLGGGSI